MESAILDLSRQLTSKNKGSDCDSTFKDIVMLLESKYKSYLLTKTNGITQGRSQNLTKIMNRASSYNLISDNDQKVLEDAKQELAIIKELETRNQEITIECDKWKLEATRTQQFHLPIPSILAVASGEGINSIVMQLIQSIKQLQELELANKNLRTVNEALNVHGFFIIGQTRSTC
jgi:uncharacterized protein YcgL (UPF0745 family)